MTPDKILRASLLDIIFENRNKSYGAYSLRKNYHHNIAMAMLIALLIAAFFSALLLMQKRNVNITGRFVPGEEYKLTEVIIPNDLPKPPEVPAVQNVIPPATVDVRSVDLTSLIQLVRDDIGARIPTERDIDRYVISNINNPLGTGITTIVPPKTGSPVGTITTTTAAATRVIGSNDRVQVPAMFPGGMDALIKFLEENLRVPASLEQGESKRVVATFVVNADGVIDAIQISSSSGKIFDDEVIRVVKLMPKWKPAKQQDHNVPVYFSLPVIFTVSDE